MRILSIPFRSIPHYLAFLALCCVVAWFLLPSAPQMYVTVSVAYLIACIAASVVVTLVLPGRESVPAEGPFSALTTKESWASTVFYCSPIWIAVVLVMGFFQFPLGHLLFIIFSVPGVVLIVGYRWGKLAIEYRQSGQYTTEEPDEWAEARKRMGVD